MFNQEQYIKEFYEKNDALVEKGFSWGTLYENEEWNQYMSLTPIPLSELSYQNILKATTEIGRIIQKYYWHVWDTPEILGRLKLNPHILDAIKGGKDNLFSYLCRFDFIINGDDIKLIEINADTPTGLVEPSIANRYLIEGTEYKHLNTHEECLTNMWSQFIKRYKIPSDEYIYFTSYDWHDEDRETTEMIMEQCLHKNKQYVGVQDLMVNESGLYDAYGNPIKYLYRLYPLEYLLDDKDDDGRPIGRWLLKHIADGKVIMLNPPSSIIPQHKGFLALLWDEYEKGKLFTAEEKEIIRKYFLPTYFTPGLLKDYVEKPIFGREGGGVRIVTKEVQEEDNTEYYRNQDMIYQQYVDMPKQVIDTWDGPYEGRLLVGSHLIGGKPAGIFYRIGEPITGNLSMFAPVGIK
ncbi:glutathionylspermidine synthase_gp058 [Bacillus phage vB_BceM_WH1]|nr:glutathionylspermidine synthase_gp058 [Bacillus phage vB_BceM_WH1]